MTEREKFERWIGSPTMLTCDSTSDSNFCYEQPYTVGAWAAWQEQRKRVLDEVLRGLYSESDSTQLRAIISEIELLRKKAEEVEI